MSIFKRKQEIRAETISYEDALLQAILNPTQITKEVAKQIPTLNGAIDLISNIIASTPIRLYTAKDGKASEVKDDPRIPLLNDDTGDTLNAHDFWKAIVNDYFLGKGGYAYINKEKGKVKSLHYVDEAQISIQKNTDPIFKDYDFLVYGKQYKPYDFLKILRNSKDGASGNGIVSENSRVLEVIYESLRFESALVKKGGNKKGFLQSQKKLSDAAMKELKEAFKKLYGNNDENVVVLNEGIEFKESSNTSVEMQLNENKKTNADEIGKIFHVSPGVISGNATEQEISSLAKLAAVPLMNTIQCALNRDLLLEKEKRFFYWAFDTKELLKGGMKERFEAYKAGIESNVLQIDEARYMEDLPAFGLKWIKLGLNDVLYDVKTGTIYTPNTNQTNSIEENQEKKGGEETESGDQS
jgi:HK97 family phage portal protein